MADIALAASVRSWPDRLHRFLLDHGGGRIVDRLLGAEQTRDSSFEVLLIDDVCSFLSPSLVSLVKGRGAEVIGVYDPEDGSDAKRRLLECGISDVLESQATPEEFLAEITQVLAHKASGSPSSPSPRSGALSIGLTGPCAGVGTTEVSIALARSLSIDVATTLIDLDQVWPSIAQRLDLPVHPNLRTALDHALHAPHRMPSAMHVLEGLAIVGGRADGGQASPIARHELVALLDALGDSSGVVVADLGSVPDVDGGLLEEFDAVIVVGTPTPVGVVRMMRVIDHLESLGTRQVLAVVNMADRSSFRRSETLAELRRANPDLPVITLPWDRRLGEAAWDGTTVYGSRYRKAIGSIAGLVVESMQ